jgi:hypothetical protein
MRPGTGDRRGANDRVEAVAVVNLEPARQREPKRLRLTDGVRTSGLPLKRSR